MDCGGVFVKYILFIFNILFAICGILLIVFGSIMVSQISGITSNVQQTFEANSVPIIVLILGCVIFVIAFMGCWGAIRENTCCTMSYSVMMLLLFFCQLALIIFVWTQRTKFLASVDQAVAQIWNQRKTDRQVMNALEITFNCCGKNSFTDYATSLETVPNSCCGATATSCPLTQAMTKPGCTRALTSFWEKNIDIIRYAGIGVAIVELVAFIFGYCLGMQVRNERRRANY